jgi:hypothetical protein
MPDDNEFVTISELFDILVQPLHGSRHLLNDVGHPHRGAEIVGERGRIDTTQPRTAPMRKAKRPCMSER